MESRHEMALIGGRLRAARLGAQSTQLDAARAASVQRATVSNWEAGRHLPCLIQFKALVTLYGVTGYQVLFGANAFEMTRDEAAEMRACSEKCSESLRMKVDTLLVLMAGNGALR